MLRIAVPNKGRLADQTLTLFERAGLKAESRVDRALVANLGEGFQAIFVRAQDIPEFVGDGAADLGVTGADLLAESSQNVVELLDLEFGRCRLCVAVREESSIRDPRELEEGTRVATSFPKATGRFFRELEVDVKVAPVSGAAEIAPHLGVADVIVDLVSTGSTLKVNGLREIGTIMEKILGPRGQHERPAHGPRRLDRGGHPLDREGKIINRPGTVTRGILDGASGQARLRRHAHRLGHHAGIVSKTVLQIRTDRQRCGIDEASGMGDGFVAGNRALAVGTPEHVGEPGAGGGERLEAEAIEQACRPHIPRIRQDKRSRALMQQYEPRRLFRCIGGGVHFARSLAKRR